MNTFLEAQHLHALTGGIFDKRDVCLDHTIADLIGLHRAITFKRHLDQAALQFCHDKPLLFKVLPGFSTHKSTLF